MRPPRPSSTEPWWMSSVRYSVDGKLLAAGCYATAADFERIGPGRLARPKDAPLDRPKRGCACCGQKFQPTFKRRMLCTGCFYIASR